MHTARRLACRHHLGSASPRRWYAIPPSADSIVRGRTDDVQHEEDISSLSRPNGTFESSHDGLDNAGNRSRSKSSPLFDARLSHRKASPAIGEDVKLLGAFSDGDHLDAIREEVEFDSMSTRFPPHVHSLWMKVLEGDEEGAWQEFHETLQKGKSGDGIVSIWHWYIMASLIARDPSVPIQDVLEMASPRTVRNYLEGVIFQSLADSSELGGPIMQQRILTFTVMHNLRKRMTVAALKAVVDVFERLQRANISPTTRIVNSLCAALIHLQRPEEALEQLARSLSSPYRKTHGKGQSSDNAGWSEPSINEYTVTVFMFAFLLEGDPSRAYGFFKFATKRDSDFRSSPIVMTLLLWAGRQAYDGIAMHQAVRSRSINFGAATHDLTHWKGQSLWEGKPSVLQAQAIFKQQLFHHYPDLAQVHNPLYDVDANDGNGFMWKAHASLQRWKESFRGIISPYSYTRPTVSGETLFAGAGTVPSFEEQKREKRLHLNELVFEQYLELLPYVNAFEEVPWEEYVLVMAWMKHLHIVPNGYSIMRVCWAIDHLIPPVADSFDDTSAAGPLHNFFSEWIGEDKIPHRNQLHAHIRNRQYGGF